MVINNRNESFIDLSSPLCNGDNKYDIVYGPVANDDVIGSMVLFVNLYNY